MVIHLFFCDLSNAVKKYKRNMILFYLEIYFKMFRNWSLNFRYMYFLNSYFE